VRGSNQEIEIKGPVLAVFEGSKAVEDEGLSRRGAGSKLFVEQEAVAAESFGLTLQGAVRDTEFAADLSQTRAADEAMEERAEEVRVSQPVGGCEGLRTEVPATVKT
jgi:hypothetical protein